MNPLLKARIINRMNHLSYESNINTTAATTTSTKHPKQHQHPHQHQQQPLPDSASHLIHNSLSEFDVINGRGQGARRHPGNIKYRTLVNLNKELYANSLCGDKSKISKGIVAALRKLGGRFLELDERTGIGVYHDIGDKKAWEKTSQALRDGQPKIRQRRVLHIKSAHAHHDGSALRSISTKGFFGHSPFRPDVGIVVQSKR